VLGAAGLTLALVLAGVMLVPALLGMQRYVIDGGSMTGTYDRGSIVFERAVPVGQLHVGDVITYDPPPTAHVDGLVTHRIYAIHTGTVPERGQSPKAAATYYRTKGDANAHPDPWRFMLPSASQPRVVFAIPYLGYAFAALGIRWVRMLVIGLPAIAVALALLARMWRVAGEEARARATAES
jgi:signal peptidase